MVIYETMTNKNFLILGSHTDGWVRPTSYVLILKPYSPTNKLLHLTICKHTTNSNPIAWTHPLLHQCIVKRVSTVSEDISFRDILICLFTRQLWQQSLAPGTGLEINIASFMYLSARCFLPPFIPTISFILFSYFLLFLPVFILSHFWKTGSTGVKLMWWKTTGISLWAICFAVMATLSLLSVALGFLLRLGAYCKLASSYLRLAAKCITDLTPCQAHPSWNQLHAQIRPNFVSVMLSFLWFFICLKVS